MKKPMEKVKDIVADIQAVVTIIVEDVIGLIFTPVWYLIDIVERSIEVCKPQNGDEPQEPQHHIGFHQ